MLKLLANEYEVGVINHMTSMGLDVIDENDQAKVLEAAQQVSVLAKSTFIIDDSGEKVGGRFPKMVDSLSVDFNAKLVDYTPKQLVSYLLATLYNLDGGTTWKDIAEL